MDFNTAVNAVKNFSVKILDVINNAYVPKWGNQQKYVVVHYLGVAGQNNKIEKNGCGAHFYVYWDGRIYQAVSEDAIVWQVGTAGYYTQKHPIACNDNVLGIEMCPKCDGDSSRADDPYWYFTEETQIATAALCVKLLKERNLPISHLLRHFDVVNKICPVPYVQNNEYKGTWTWAFFVSVVKAVLEGMAPTTPKTEETNWNPTGTAISNGNGVNVRRAPGGAVIGKLNRGNRFEIDGTSSGDWIHVRVAGVGVGYVHKDRVILDQPQPPAGQWIQEKDGRWWFRHTDGGYTRSAWEFINGAWYFFDASGWMLEECYVYNQKEKNYFWLKKGGAWDGVTLPDPRRWPVTEY